MQKQVQIMEERIMNMNEWETQLVMAERVKSVEM